MTKRWDTLRIALWGAAFGVAYSAIKLTIDGFATLNSDSLAYAGGLFGGAVGGAAIFAIVSGMRNLILRAK
jgi:hypothetical protein